MLPPPEPFPAQRAVRLLVSADRYLRLVRGVIEESNARGNLGFDAQIAAVCLEHGATTLLTEDRDNASFRSLKLLTLEVFLSH